MIFRPSYTFQHGSPKQTILDPLVTLVVEGILCHAFLHQEKKWMVIGERRFFDKALGDSPSYHSLAMLGSLRGAPQIPESQDVSSACSHMFTTRENNPRTASRTSQTIN